MQPPTDIPRDTLTEALVHGLIRDADAIVVGAGLELIDRNLTVVDNITADLAGGSVSRNSYATLHGTCTLQITRQLDWGRALVRPYYTITDGVTKAEFRLGAYFTSTPELQLEETPPTYTVDGYDILLALNDYVGDAYAIDTGVSYLTAVESILVQQGYTQYLIDPARADAVLATPGTWFMDDKTTWLGIVNDLLAAVGYAGIWSDWHGRLRCEPYRTPRERSTEWTYTVDGLTSMVGAGRSVARDFFDAPNRWVYYRSGDVDGPAPTEGAGKYTYVNQAVGDTSVEARDRTITRQPVLVDAVDQDALVAQAVQGIDADMAVKTAVSCPTAPNPLHWHFDRLLLNDPALGPPVSVLGTSWTLPLDGSDMTHDMTVLQ